MVTPTTTETGWQLQADAAEAYEAYLVPAIFRRLARRLVEVADPRPGQRVLDVACGTGIVTRTAAPRVGATGAVVGVDVNPRMLATARQHTAGLAPTVELREGDAAALPFDDGAFDVVVCQEAVQFLPDRAAAIGEMRRVAAPGGRVAFSVLRSLAHNPVYGIFVDALAEHVGEEAAAMMRSPFVLGDAGRLRRLAEGAGLGEVAVRVAVNEERFPSIPEFVRREAASSPLAGPLSELAADRRAALIATLEDALAGHRDDDGLVFHNETHIVTGRA